MRAYEVLRQLEPIAADLATVARVDADEAVQLNVYDQEGWVVGDMRPDFSDSTVVERRDIYPIRGDIEAVRFMTDEAIGWLRESEFVELAAKVSIGAVTRLARNTPAIVDPDGNSYRRRDGKRLVRNIGDLSDGVLRHYVLAGDHREDDELTAAHRLTAFAGSSVRNAMDYPYLQPKTPDTEYETMPEPRARAVSRIHDDRTWTGPTGP